MVTSLTKDRPLLLRVCTYKNNNVAETNQRQRSVTSLLNECLINQLSLHYGKACKIKMLLSRASVPD